MRDGGVVVNEGNQHWRGHYWRATYWDVCLMTVKGAGVLEGRNNFTDTNTRSRKTLHDSLTNSGSYCYDASE